LYLASLFISLACLLPLMLLFVAWAVPLAPASQESWHHLLATTLFENAANTLALSAGVALLSALIGVSAAWFITRCEFPGRRMLSWLLIMPLAMPSYLLAMSYGSLLEFAGPVQSALRAWFGWQAGDYWFPPVRSLGGAVVLLALSSVPYVYMLARLAFRSQPQEWFEVAQSLGKTRRQLFWQVALPAARPFVIIGVILAVMETIADIGTVHMLGVPALSTGIYRTWFLMGEPLLAARIAALLLLIAAALLWLEHISRRGARYDSLRIQPLPRRTLKPHKRWLIAIYCALPALFGFVVPLVWMIRLSWYHTETVTASSLLAQSMDSLMLMASAAALVVGVSLLMAYGERIRGRLRHINLAASLGYAMPGVVIAVGLLLIQGLVKDTLGYAMLMTGGMLGLMMAYLIRFLSPSYSALHSGYQRLARETDMVAESLGKSRWQIFFQVHLPSLRFPVVMAALIVAIDVLKELPATLILRPFDVKTLAVAVYEFASDDRPVEAAPYALVMVAIAALAVVILHRLQERSHGAA